ncbi:MAG: chorismate mutase [Candidatus Gracilibacteria bacterium]
MEKIEKLRGKIDTIDKKIAAKLRKRARLVAKIGQIKSSKNSPIFDSLREQEIMATLETDYERAIFKKILAESRKLEGR